MTILIGGTKPVILTQPHVDMSDMAAGTVTVATATAYRLTQGTSYDQFTGSFTYDSNGVLISGSITGWKRVTAGGVEFTATGISLPVADFLSYLASDNTPGFLGTVFGGDDKITGSATFDELRGGDGNDTISGGAGNENLLGGSGNDVIAGGTGSDFIDGGAGVDTLAGGAGNDRYSIFDGAGDVIIEAAGKGSDVIQTNLGAFSLETLSNVEHLLLLAPGSTGTGNALNNSIVAFTGSDTLNGGLGNDTLDGGLGADVMTGGKGHDTYVINDGGDVVIENAGEGTDTILSLLPDSSLAIAGLLEVENLTLIGSALNGFGNELVNVITGNDAANDLRGLDGNDTLIGGAGLDTLRGGAGKNLLVGGAGDDIYAVDDPGDKVVEGADAASGYDRVFASVSYKLAANVEELNLTDAMSASNHNGTGNASNNNIFGNDIDNRLLGLAGADLLVGALGSDTLDGGEGVDDLSGGDGNDRLIGGNGQDFLTGGVGADTMIGGAGNDFYTTDDEDLVSEAPGQGLDTVVARFAYTLPPNIENLILLATAEFGEGNALNNKMTGSAGNDTLVGGLGNDTLDGGAGVDSLAGGKGNDVYVVDNAGDTVTENLNEGTDTVQSSLLNSDLGPAKFDNVENLILLSGALNGLGNSLGNVITGNDADNDLNGFEGNDTTIGGNGNDTHHVNSAGDKVVELSGANSGIDTIITSTNYALSANVERLILDFAATNGTGNVQDNSIQGNAAANKLLGLAGDDGLEGRDGNDTLDGGAGNDGLFGGNDNDKLFGGAGKDSLNGGSGNDTIAGGDGDDSIAGESGADSIAGDAGRDVLAGGADNDVIAGGAGDDNLDGGLGADTMLGGAGNDFYIVDDAGDTITELAGQGFDSISTLLTNFSLDTAALKNIERLSLDFPGIGTGNALNNWLVGSGGNDTLIGGLGNDTLEGAFGDDSMVGGKGNDFYIVDQAGDIVIENAGEGTDTLQSSLKNTSLAGPAFASIENLSLVLDALNGTGNDLANLITGSEGNNSLDGAAGNDTMLGGEGDDTYVVGSAADKIVEFAIVGSGFDRVEATVNYVLSTNIEQLYLLDGALNGTGNAQDNGIFANAAANKLFGGAGNDDLRGEGGSDTLDGGTGNDSMSGGDDNDKLFGGAGNDRLAGDLGVDSMAGGAGNDSYVVDNAADQVIEAAGQGADLVTAFGDFTYTLALNVENLDLLLEADGVGNGLANRIDGGGDFSGDNTMLGGGGNDTLIGGSGSDVMFGDAGRDTFAIAEIDGAVEFVTDFAAGKSGDALDLSDLLTGFVSGSSNANDFVRFMDGGATTIVQIDADGAANGAAFVDACFLPGVTLTNVSQAVTDGNLVLA